MTRKRQREAGYRRGDAGPGPHPCDYSQSLWTRPFSLGHLLLSLGRPLSLTWERCTEREKLWNWRESMALEEFWHIVPDRWRGLTKGRQFSLFQGKSSTFVHHSTLQAVWSWQIISQPWSHTTRSIHIWWTKYYQSCFEKPTSSTMKNVATMLGMELPFNPTNNLTSYSNPSRRHKTQCRNVSDLQTLMPTTLNCFVSCCSSSLSLTRGRWPCHMPWDPLEVSSVHQAPAAKHTMYAKFSHAIILCWCAQILPLCYLSG